MESQHFVCFAHFIVSQKVFSVAPQKTLVDAFCGGLVLLQLRFVLVRGGTRVLDVHD